MKVPDWIRITDADVSPGTEYWRLSKVEYWDDQRSGGTHHIYTMMPYDRNERIVVSNGQQSWPVPLDKPNSEPPSNFAMWGGNYYSAWMDGQPSDKIEGMHMPAKHHVSYLLWWERSVKSGGGSGSASSSTQQTDNNGAPAPSSGTSGTSLPSTGTPPVSSTPSPAAPREMIDIPDWIRVKDANVVPGTKYWRLKKVEYWDDKKSRGTHHIYTKSPYNPSVKIVVSNGQQSWKVPLDKPTSEPSSNFAMWGGNYYSAWMDGLPSDRIEGMHMPSKHHVSYLLWWEETVAGGGSGRASVDRSSATDAASQRTPLYQPPTPTAPQKPFKGEIIQTFKNRGLTQVFGVVHDANGRPKTDVRVRLTWAGGQTYYAPAGNYVCNETDASGWDFFLNGHPVANTWLVAVVDQEGNLLSEEVAVRTDSHANAGAVNVAKIRFVANR